MDYSTMSINELKSICKQRKIKGVSGKNKQVLVNMINENETNPVSTPTTLSSHEDSYTKEILQRRYAGHKAYIESVLEIKKQTSLDIRLPCIPEDISENIVKFILHYKLNDKTSRWDCKKGDLQSQQEGKQEVKCFTSVGPLSFTPSSEWDVIYFLDARDWLNDKFILYRITLKRTSEEWKNIKLNKTQTFEDQTKQGRRPRMSWEFLKPYVEQFCTKVYEGTFDDIFIHVGVEE